MNKRIEKLRQESLDTQPYISIERASLLTEAYKKYEGTVSIPLLRALAFKHVLENKSICIGKGELIVGERGALPQATPWVQVTNATLNFGIICQKKGVAYGSLLSVKH